MTVDLHIHSDVSDGTVPPREVVRRAASSGLSTIALTDHDDLGGIACALDAGVKSGVRVVPAVELTARVGPGLGTVHIVALGVEPTSPALLDVARRSRLGKRRQVELMVEKLRAGGVDIDDDDVGIVKGEERYLGRNRIASFLVREGFFKDRVKAFKKWLNPGGRYFVEPEVAPAADVVSAVKAAGGIAVLAHPTDDDLERHLEPLVACGIEGIELWRPRLAGSLLQRTEKAAKIHGLLASGGSDWHGLYPSAPLGEWKVSDEKVRDLVARLGG